MFLINNILSQYLHPQDIDLVVQFSPLSCIVYNSNAIPSYDFNTDSSKYKYVGPFSRLQNDQYVPSDLVVVDTTGNSKVQVQGHQGKLRKDAMIALYTLADAFYAHFGVPLVVVSSYRSYAYQKQLYEGYVAAHGLSKARGFSAKPGYSEHQLGLAVDLFDVSGGQRSKVTTYFARMRQHAHKYGRTQSYQKGITVDGYIVEPWHWRYVGVELATYLWDNNMTFTEYVRFWWVWRAGKNY